MSDSEGFEDHEEKEEININNRQSLRQSLHNFNISQIEQMHNISNNTTENKYELPSQINNSHSLAPDMANGWRPKINTNDLHPPISLSFEDRDLNYIISRLNKTQKYSILYLGFRPTNSYEMHKKISQYGNYNIRFGSILFDEQVLQNYNINIVNKSSSPIKNQIQQRPFEGMHPYYPTNSISFSGDLEGGNLDAVIRISENEYDLLLRPDTNTQGHQNWFNFIIFNTQKDRTIKLNLKNLTRKKNLYEQNQMSPFTRSKINLSSKVQQKINEGWKNDECFNIIHETRATLKYDFQQGNKELFTLSFEYKFQNDNDEVQFSSCPAYTYSLMRDNLRSYSKNICFKETVFCKSLTGLVIPMITITDKSNYNTESMNAEEKQVIVITGRFHPGEQNSSWIIQGIMDYLNQNSQEYKTRNFLIKTIIKIIPMMNPDGVVMGNFRCDLVGNDINRIFSESYEQVCPQNKALKQLIIQLKETFNRDQIYFFDIHGNYAKNNCFIYGPEFQEDDFRFYLSKLICLALEEKNPYFKHSQSNFKDQKHLKFCPRVRLKKKYNIDYSYQIECSTGSYFDKETQEFKKYNVQDWLDLGENLVEAIENQIEQIETYQNIKEAQYQLSLQNKANQENKNCSNGPYSNRHCGCECQNHIQEKSTNPFHKLSKMKIPNQESKDSILKIKIPDIGLQYNLKPLIQQIQQIYTFQSSFQDPLQTQQLSKETNQDLNNISMSQIDSENSDDDLQECVRDIIKDSILEQINQFTNHIQNLNQPNLNKQKNQKLVLKAPQVSIGGVLKRTADLPAPIVPQLEFNKLQTNNQLKGQAQQQEQDQKMFQSPQKVGKDQMSFLNQQQQQLTILEGIKKEKLKKKGQRKRGLTQNEKGIKSQFQNQLDLQNLSQNQEQLQNSDEGADSNYYLLQKDGAKQQKKHLHQFSPQSLFPNILGDSNKKQKKIQLKRQVLPISVIGDVKQYQSQMQLQQQQQQAYLKYQNTLQEGNLNTLDDYIKIQSVIQNSKSQEMLEQTLKQLNVQKLLNSGQATKQTNSPYTNQNSGSLLQQQQQQIQQQQMQQQLLIQQQKEQKIKLEVKGHQHINVNNRNLNKLNSIQGTNSLINSLVSQGNGSQQSMKNLYDQLLQMCSVKQQQQQKNQLTNPVYDTSFQQFQSELYAKLSQENNTNFNTIKVNSNDKQLSQLYKSTAISAYSNQASINIQKALGPNINNNASHHQNSNVSVFSSNSNFSNQQNHNSSQQIQNQNAWNSINPYLNNISINQSQQQQINQYSSENFKQKPNLPENSQLPYNNQYFTPLQYHQRQFSDKIQVNSSQSNYSNINNEQNQNQNKDINLSYGGTNLNIIKNNNFKEFEYQRYNQDKKNEIYNDFDILTQKIKDGPRQSQSKDNSPLIQQNQINSLNLKRDNYSPEKNQLNYKQK